MTAGQIAALIAAAFWVLLVLVLVFVLGRLARLISVATRALSQLADKSGPLLDNAQTAVWETREQLAKVDVITTNKALASADVAALVRLLRLILIGPVLRLLALSHGVRRALSGRRT